MNPFPNSYRAVISENTNLRALSVRVYARKLCYHNELRVPTFAPRPAGRPAGESFFLATRFRIAEVARPHSRPPGCSGCRAFLAAPPKRIPPPLLRAPSACAWRHICVCGQTTSAQAEGLGCLGVGWANGGQERKFQINFRENSPERRSFQRSSPPGHARAPVEKVFLSGSREEGSCS